MLITLQMLTGKSEWLFPGDRSSKKPMSNKTILKALERMGYKGRMTGHGFRGLASTILHEQGYQLSTSNCSLPTRRATPSVQPIIMRSTWSHARR